ncbi:MAG: aminotransferase class III-fold pyridoxal phosphate-dependent enzyme [Chloroflexota bacterium]
MKPNEIQELTELALKHVWVPRRTWKELSAPGGFIIFTKGEGRRATDINGNTYLDYFGAVNGCGGVGWGRREIADAAYEQMLKLNYAPNHELSIPKIKLAKKLADLAPTGKLSKVFFASGGAESVETAMAISRKYHIISGYRNKHKIIGGYTYHGSTVATKATGWRRPSFHWEDFEPLMPGVIHIPSPYCAVCDLGLEYPSCRIACARYVERVIREEGPETVTAFLDVPIASTCYVPPPEYWPMIRSICDKYDVLLILDEIVTGFGRTGKMFASEHWGIKPDITVVGKAFASGYIPLSAAIVAREVAEKFEGGPEKMLHHSYTYEGHATACAAALATIEIIEKENLTEHARIMGEYMFEGLKTLYKHRIVGDIRSGLGLMCQVELMKNRDNKERFSTQENSNIAHLLREGLMAYGLFGLFTNPIWVCPMMTITRVEIDEMISAFDRAIGDVERRVGVDTLIQ